MSVPLRSRVRKTIEDLVPVLQKRRFAQRSFSQEGEDMLLERFFGYQADGFYVDIGAHHPFRFSNTQRFYERGWRGINIDAMPGSMAPFQRLRARDVNLEVGVGESATTARFFMFNEPALNTFDEATARKHEIAPWRIERIVQVEVKPLGDILGKHLPARTTIDFMSIDVEGRDLEVLRSNDWDRFRPRVILAESLGKTLAELSADPTAAYLGEQGYVPFAKTVNTFMFVENSAR